MPSYEFDAGSSRFTVQAFAGGMLSIMAHSPTFAIREFTGELRFASEALDGGVLRMTIKAGSLRLVDQVKPADRHEIESRMLQEVLEISTWPEVRFESNAIAATRIADNWHRLQIQGTVLLHGVSQAHPIDAQMRTQEEEMRLSGDSKLRQSAFRIKKVTALAGTITLKDELKFAFDLIGRRRNQ